MLIHLLVKLGPTEQDEEFTDEDRRLLDDLPYASSAIYNRYDRQELPECLPDTRTALLAEIMAWVRGPTPLIRDKKQRSEEAATAALTSTRTGAHAGPCHSKRIYWLDGMAGTGKSTIARTVARRCSEEGRLGASFFFSRGGGELETARKFVTSIAVQLARRSLRLRRHICDAVRADDDDDVTHLALSDQWKRLVLRPFEKLGAAALDTPLVLIVDALDECRHEAEIDVVLRLLCDLPLSQTAGQLLVFLTSRPEVPFRIGLTDGAQAGHLHVILHYVDQSVVDRDIMIYLRHTLNKIRQKNCLPQRWPSQECLEHLVRRAGGLFIWAAVACRYISSGRRFAARRLDNLLRENSSVSSTAESALDEIYLTVLRCSTQGDYTDEENKELQHLLQTVLGSITSLFSSLSQPSLASLLDIDEDEITSILGSLHFIIDIPSESDQPICLHHASFRDFLHNDSRCCDDSFYVDKQKAHMELARYCLRVMEEGLKKDICYLRLPGATADDVGSEQLNLRLPSHLRYACVYWAQHVRHVGNPLMKTALVTS